MKIPTDPLANLQTVDPEGALKHPKRIPTPAEAFEPQSQPQQVY